MKQKTAKKNTKKRRRINIPGIITLTFALTGVLYLASCLFVKSYNISLDLQRQEYETQIAAITEENETLNYEIKELTGYERIMSIAGSDLESSTEDVYTVSE